MWPSRDLPKKSVFHVLQQVSSSVRSHPLTEGGGLVLYCSSASNLASFIDVLILNDRPISTQKRQTLMRATCFADEQGSLHAPIEKIDIADWLFNLPDAEYQHCSHAHIAAGTTTTDDSRPTPLGWKRWGREVLLSLLSRLVPRLGWSLAAKSSAIESESSDFFGGSPGGVVSWYNLDRLERC